MGSVIGCAANGDATDDGNDYGNLADGGLVDAVADYGQVPDAAARDAGFGYDAGHLDSGGYDAGTDASSTACPATDSCAAATAVQAVRGDEGSDTQTASGYTSEWLQIPVTESEGSPWAHPLQLTATLTSPPGENFDVFIYVDESGNETSRACGPVSNASSTNPAGYDTATFAWGESGAFANDKTDDRIVTVEVRHVSGGCSPNAKWTLTLKGD